VKLVVAALLLSSAAAAHPRVKETVVAQAAPDDAVHVGEIVFEGADPKGLSTLVNIAEGAALDGRMVREAVRALHGSARFARVSAYVEPLPAEKLHAGWKRGVRLVFVLTPVRKLVALSFPGRAALPETVLAQTANLQVNTEFQESLVRRATDSIQAAYYRQGYRAARVTPVPKPSADGIALDLRICRPKSCPSPSGSRRGTCSISPCSTKACAACAIAIARLVGCAPA
jgi:outer membrane protein assembly factor BamA